MGLHEKSVEELAKELKVTTNYILSILKERHINVSSPCESLNSDYCGLVISIVKMRTSNISTNQTKKPFKDFDKVEHLSKGYKGFIDGETSIGTLFEEKGDKFEYRIQVFQQNGYLLKFLGHVFASPKNLRFIGELTIRDKHQIYLHSKGFAYNGQRKKTKFHREPWCWNCGKDLNNYYDEECVNCGWIICDCGACGCGKPKEYKYNNQDRYSK